MSFLNYIKTTVDTRDVFVCEQVKNNHYFPGFLFQSQIEITCGLVLFLFNSILKQRTFFLVVDDESKVVLIYFCFFRNMKKKVEMVKNTVLEWRRCMEDLFECVVKLIPKMLLDVTSELLF